MHKCNNAKNSLKVFVSLKMGHIKFFNISDNQKFIDLFFLPHKLELFLFETIFHILKHSYILYPDFFFHE